MPVPLACKLNAPRQAHWMTEMTLSRKVLIESSSDASILSSVIGSYDDCNFTIGSTSFMQQGSNDQSSFAFHHSSNLFITLLHLMEPYHVSMYRCVCARVCAHVCVCVSVCLYMCVYLCVYVFACARLSNQFYETLKSDHSKPCNWHCC